jgi:hypothetical protein
MLQALEPRLRLEKGPALSPRLQAMLEKKRLTLPLSTVQGRLDRTLSKAQETRKTEASSKDQKSSGETLRKADKP